MQNKCQVANIMEILRMLKSDKVEVVSMAETASGHADYIKDIFDEWMESGVFLKAVIDGRIVGIIHVRVFEDFAWLEGLRVNISHRRRGIGRLLTLKAMEISRSKVIRLLIRKNNKPSLALATSLSFRQIDKIYYHGGTSKSFSEISMSLGLKRAKETLQCGYMDGWRWFPREYYLSSLFIGTSDNEEIVALETSPIFLVKGNIKVIEHASRNPRGGSCFIVLEYNSMDVVKLA